MEVMAGGKTRALTLPPASCLHSCSSQPFCNSGTAKGGAPAAPAHHLPSSKLHRQ